MLMVNEPVKDLKDATDLMMAGGKAVALSKMIRADFPVPNGFVITTTAQMEMTPQLEKQILDKFDGLGAQYVAVRSSGIAEDSHDAAWAGQFESYLNVPRAELIEKIKTCWESANSDRAKSYAERLGIPVVGPIAVIVQSMVESEVSGIAFSVNPITKDAKEIVIEAGYGLGEAFVSGLITPDTYLVDKFKGTIVEKHISRQLKKLIQGEDGNNTWENIGEFGSNQKLPDKYIQKLAALITKVEIHAKYEVDAEWAFVDGNFYILQCRPITTLR